MMTHQYMQEIVAEDIQKFGLIPEFIGRLPVPCGPGTVNGGRLGSYLDRA